MGKGVLLVGFLSGLDLSDCKGIFGKQFLLLPPMLPLGGYVFMPFILHLLNGQQGSVHLHDCFLLALIPDYAEVVLDQSAKAAAVP